MADVENRTGSLVEPHHGDIVASIGEILSNLRYGNILLVVHEGRVVQIDVTEKKRLKLD